MLLQLQKKRLRDVSKPSYPLLNDRKSRVVGLWISNLSQFRWLLEVTANTSSCREARGWRVFVGRAIGSFPPGPGGIQFASGKAWSPISGTPDGRLRKAKKTSRTISDQSPTTSTALSNSRVMRIPCTRWHSPRRSADYSKRSHRTYRSIKKPLISFTQFPFRRSPTVRKGLMVAPRRIELLFAP